jgi:hypothetical protein
MPCQRTSQRLHNRKRKADLPRNHHPGSATDDRDQFLSVWRNLKHETYQCPHVKKAARRATLSRERHPNLEFLEIVSRNLEGLRPNKSDSELYIIEYSCLLFTEALARVITGANGGLMASSHGMLDVLATGRVRHILQPEVSRQYGVPENCGRETRQHPSHLYYHASASNVRQQRRVGKLV